MTSPPPALDAVRPLLAESGGYAAIEAGQNAIALVTIGVLLPWIGPADFGRITMALVASQVATALATLGSEFAVLRLYLQWPDQTRRASAAGVLALATAWSTVLAASGWGVAVLLQTPAGDIVLVGWWGGLLLGLRTIPLAIARIQGNVRVYATVVVAGSLLQAIAQVVLVIRVAPDLGFVAGQLVGAVGSAALAATLTADGWRSTAPRIGRDVVTYTLGVLPSNLSNRLLMVADRAILAQVVSLESLGAYGLAARLSLPVKLVGNSFRMAVAPAMSRAEQSGDLDAVFAHSRRLIVLATFAAGAAVSLAALVLHLTSWAPLAAAVSVLLGILLWAQVVGAAQSMAQLRIYYSKRPGTSAGPSIAGAVVLVAGLLLLAPPFGGVGAALAEVLAAFVGLGAAVWVSARAGHAVGDWGGSLGITLAFGLVAAAALGGVVVQGLVFATALVIVALVLWTDLRQAGLTGTSVSA